MSRLRAAVIVVLLVTPVLVFVGLGAWALWQSGQWLWLWLAIPLCWGAALLLARWWGGRLIPTHPPSPDLPPYWTPRDARAWQLVQNRIEAADQIDPTRWITLQFYVETGRQMAEEIARIYHPRAADPLESLTIPEILAALQLALEDLSELWDRYVPGGHWLTVKNWRSLSKLPRRYRFVSNLLTVGSALFSPVAALGRLAVSKTVTEPVSRLIQSNMLEWFYVAFLQRLGFYLIEMNSGRLKGGKETFRQAVARIRAKEKPWEKATDKTSPETTSDTEDPSFSGLTDHPAETQTEPKAGPSLPSAASGGKDDETLLPTETADEKTSFPTTTETPSEPLSPSSATNTHSAAEDAESSPSRKKKPAGESTEEQLTLCVLGQTGSGRSRLIAVLQGEQSSPPEHLHKTTTVKIHRLTLPGSAESLRLLEPPGYNAFAESPLLRRERLRAVQETDGLLLVLDACRPIWEPDQDLLEEIYAHYEEHPEEKPPPLLIVLTHIDQLAPAEEWNLPCNWQPEQKTEPKSQKEQSIREALAVARRTFGSKAFAIVPVCTGGNNRAPFGVQEFLLPALLDFTDAARAVHSLRELNKELNRSKISRVLRQAWNLGKAWWKK